jgi:DNA-binding Lrp family transcriptional regulator
MAKDPNRVPYIPSELITNPSVTHVQFRVWCLIRIKQGNNASMWHSISSLARMLGMDRAQVAKAVKHLVHLGFLERDGFHISCQLPLDLCLTDTLTVSQEHTHCVSQTQDPCLTVTPPVSHRHTNIYKNIYKEEREREVANRSEEAAAQSPALSPSNLKKEEAEALERRDRLGKELARIQSTRLLAETLLPFTRYFTLEGAYQDILPRLLVLTPSEVGALKIFLVSKSDRPNPLAKVLSWFLQDLQKGTVTLKPNQLPPRPRNGFNSVLN